MSRLLVGFVRSLKSSDKEALRELPLCEDYNDLTSPTSNHISDIFINVSVVYEFFKIIFQAFVFILLILYFNCEMKLGVLLL